MGKVLRLSAVLLNNLKWWFIKKSWVFVNCKKNNDKQPTHQNYTLGITTYKERFDSYLKPLILHLNHLFPDTQMVVAVNGFHNQEEQKIYLEKIHHFLTPFKNITFFTYNEPQGLCKLWNQIILKANSPKVFLLNDDISIYKAFRKEIETTGILNSNFGIINESYSHYLIDKSIIQKVGWFDERFPAIGYEDHDYEIRMALNGLVPEFFNFSSIKNEVVVPKDWSWGENDNIILRKYSSANEKHYLSKWEFSETDKDGFVFVRIAQGYVKLKEGMETPNFYNTIELN